MANSIFIPILRIPKSINEVQIFLTQAFKELDLPQPQVRFQSSVLPAAITDGFILVEGSKADSQCWVSISECAPELTGDDECAILADVRTRGNWVFAGVVAVALCRMGGRIIFNDAGELDGQETYTAESLWKVIEAGKGSLL